MNDPPNARATEEFYRNQRHQQRQEKEEKEAEERRKMLEDLSPMERHDFLYKEQLDRRKKRQYIVLVLSFLGIFFILLMSDFYKGTSTGNVIGTILYILGLGMIYYNTKINPANMYGEKPALDMNSNGYDNFQPIEYQESCNSESFSCNSESFCNCGSESCSKRNTVKRYFFNFCPCLMIFFALLMMSGVILLFPSDDDDTGPYPPYPPYKNPYPPYPPGKHDKILEFQFRRIFNMAIEKSYDN